MPISKPDFNLIFASQAPSQDLPAAFNNYARGWDEARKNNGKPTIKQFNYLIQQLDLKALWMIQNGAALPFDETVDYAEGAFTVKDGELQQFIGGVWKKPTQTADQIFDESGKTQQEINNTVDAKLNYSIYAVKSTPAEQTTEINTVNTNAKHVYVTDGEYTLVNSMNFYSKAYTYTPNATFKAGTLFGFNIFSGARVNGGTFKTDQGIAMRIMGGASKFSVNNTVIENTSTSSAHGFNLSQSNITDGSIIGNHITATGFGILTNTSGTNIDGIVIALNNISSKADPIEINAPNGLIHKNIPIIGNILRANRELSDHTSGFSIGIAAGRNMPVIGNVIRESKNEAIHIEDTQDTLVLIGNVAENCKSDFIRIQTGEAFVNGAGNPVPVVGNSGKSYGVGLDNSGYYGVWDGTGSVKGNSLVANRFKGFTYGIRTGRQPLVADGNIIQDCPTGILLDSYGGIFGSNYMRGVTTAVKAKTRAIVGEVIVDGAVTTLLDVSEIPAGLGVNLVDGFKLLSTPVTTLAGTPTLVTLFDMPTLGCGRVIVRIQNTASNTFAYASTDMLFNGTTATFDKTLSKVNSDITFSSTIFVVDGGKLKVSINSPNIKNVLIDVIYKGEYYK